jgi:glycosyltransferase involved in cell wall biosynthesis
MKAAPTISIGLAVRNSPELVARCIESVAAQDFGDLELVICDNASDDRTPAVLREHARADRRIKVTANEVNIGSHENMNRVLALSRGEFFRWISSDDWLETGYLSACVEALRARQDAIGVTTHFTLHGHDGSTRFEEYDGEFPDSHDAARRFERMLWFFQAGDAKYDPIYGVYRRDVLMRSHRLRPSEQTDYLLCAELALMGPIIHIPRRLAHRTRNYTVFNDRAALRRRLDPVRAESLKSSPQRLYRDLLALVREAELTEEQSGRCERALRRLWLAEVTGRGLGQILRTRHRLLGRR